MMATPMMPAMIAARSALLPAVGDTVSTRCWTTETGNAPRLSTRASERTSLSVKEPEIWTVPGKLAVCTVGADWITSSSTIASWCDRARRQAVEALLGERVPDLLTVAAEVDGDDPLLLLVEPGLGAAAVEDLTGATRRPQETDLLTVGGGQHVLPGGIGRRGLDRHVSSSATSAR